MEGRKREIVDCDLGRSSRNVIIDCSHRTMIERAESVDSVCGLLGAHAPSARRETLPMLDHALREALRTKKSRRTSGKVRRYQTGNASQIECSAGVR